MTSVIPQLSLQTISWQLPYFSVWLGFSFLHNLRSKCVPIYWILPLECLLGEPHKKCPKQIFPFVPKLNPSLCFLCWDWYSSTKWNKTWAASLLPSLITSHIRAFSNHCWVSFPNTINLSGFFHSFCLYSGLMIFHMD